MMFARTPREVFKRSSDTWVLRTALSAFTVDELRAALNIKTGRKADVIETLIARKGKRFSKTAHTPQKPVWGLPVTLGERQLRSGDLVRHGKTRRVYKATQWQGGEWRFRPWDEWNECARERRGKPLKVVKIPLVNLTFHVAPK
jgi:hypothetical protein